MATIAAQVLLKHGVRPATMMQARQPRSLIQLLSVEPDHAVGKRVMQTGWKFNGKNEPTEYYEVLKVELGCGIGEKPSKSKVWGQHYWRGKKADKAGLIKSATKPSWRLLPAERNPMESVLRTLEKQQKEAVEAASA